MSEISRTSLVEVYKVFQAQGITKVFGTHCCNRFYLGQQPARKCRTCTKLPRNVEIQSEADIDNLING